MEKQAIHISSQLGSVLKSQRTEKKLSKKQVAARGRMAPGTITALENNTECSTIESLFKLLAVLDLEIGLRHKDKAVPEG
jgi:transcriptional regulator with XRE-family HTH domain